MLFQDQVQQGTTMPIECTSQTDPGRNVVFADGVFSRESNHQRSCLIYDLLGVCCGKSVCFAAAEPRLESVQIDFVGAANVPESNMDACIAKDEKASEPSPAVRHVVQQILGGCRHREQTTAVDFLSTVHGQVLLAAVNHEEAGRDAAGVIVTT